ncbi:lysophospholipid acyltransferase family protein [Candidatus Sulfidibacterium hydrothermale]|uniref:lysophospholipid acyltransferase family protein n=1 Tax=Candidatus Sulfidibacterium hydrothermale TaxID=2875962 RepID=UPI001F0A1F83|nr:lysophospholipid acyltransferase family protein [Candidatus Sulfidibacterium hydrothermale]UBM62310.1 lysophospholipid acyltransferase family protein [Candidatus Sulfidibacterium hydrothermale]
MDYLITWVLAFFARVVGLIPFRVLYIISDGMYFFLYRIIRYRRKVVEENLRNSFPDISEKELKKLIRGSYKNLADIFVEGIKGFTMTDEQYLKRYKVKNPEILQHLRDEKKSAVFLPAHYGNWEWGTKATPSQLGFKHMVIIYKPLSNKPADLFFKKHRSQKGLIMGSIYETAKLFRKYTPDFSAFILVSDQSPPPVAKKVYWIDFLGQQTAFLRGAELFTRQYNLPVYYSEAQRIKRGYYEVSLTPIIDDPSTLPDGEITRRYAKLLEKTIRKKPEDWLWSHRRWKIKKEN